MIGVSTARPRAHACRVALGVCFGLALLAVVLPGVRAAEAAAFRVVLDAGHGGKDPGATSPLLRQSEKEITLRLALLTGAALQRRGVSVVYTRTTDVDVALSERAALAGKVGAHALVSLHLNAAHNPAAAGAEGWYGPGEGHATLAGAVLDAIAPVLRRHGSTVRGTRHSQSLTVLQTRVPATLLEVGYVTNTGDARLLGQDAFLASVAEALADGIVRFRDMRPGARPVTLNAALPAQPSLYFVQLGDTLSEIARRAGVPLAELQRINEAITPQALHVGQPIQLRVATDGTQPYGGPSGGAASNRGAAPGGGTHTVAPGETLYRLATRTGVSVQDLAQWNGITDPNRIVTGQVLRLSPPPAAGGSPATSAQPGERYTVQPGDTLSELALRWGVTIAALKDANGLANEDHILAGSVLVVPRGAPPRPAAPAAK